MAVEDIVEVGAEHHLLQAEHTLSEVERVRSVDVGLRVARQRALRALGVVEILLADEVGVPYCGFEMLDDKNF